jgi:type IV secretion system protein VirB11
MTGHPETADRRRAMLRTAMGPEIAAALADPAVIEVMVNPDGSLRLDRLGEGRIDTGVRMAPAEIERIIRLVASHVRVEIHAGNPIVSAELPPRAEGMASERFEGILPPVVLGPCFTIRKPGVRIFRLGDYIADGMLTEAQAAFLRQAVRDHRNILIVGGTSSGKTTFANALLAEMADLDERVILAEDTRELQCAAPDCIALRTVAGAVTLTALVRSILRLRPDRIIVGEVRGGEALDMLKAWNTGHPGGLATLHANSAKAALYRLEQLIQEVVPVVPRRLIAEAIDILVFIKGRGTGRRIDTIAEVTGLDTDGDYAVSDPLSPSPATGDCHVSQDPSARLDRAVFHLPSHRRRRPAVARHRPRRRLQHAVGAAAAADPRFRAGAGR